MSGHAAETTPVPVLNLAAETSRPGTGHAIAYNNPFDTDQHEDQIARDSFPPVASITQEFEKQKITYTPPRQDTIKDGTSDTTAVALLHVQGDEAGQRRQLSSSPPNPRRSSVDGLITTSELTHPADSHIAVLRQPSVSPLESQVLNRQPLAPLPVSDSVATAQNNANAHPPSAFVELPKSSPRVPVPSPTDQVLLNRSAVPLLSKRDDMRPPGLAMGRAFDSKPNLRLGPSPSPLSGDNARKMPQTRLGVKLARHVQDCIATLDINFNGRIDAETADEVLRTIGLLLPGRSVEDQLEVVDGLVQLEDLNRLALTLLNKTDLTELVYKVFASTVDMSNGLSRKDLMLLSKQVANPIDDDMLDTMMESVQLQPDGNISTDEMYHIIKRLCT